MSLELFIGMNVHSEVRNPTTAVQGLDAHEIHPPQIRGLRGIYAQIWRIKTGFLTSKQRTKGARGSLALLRQRERVRGPARPAVCRTGPGWCPSPSDPTRSLAIPLGPLCLSQHQKGWHTGQVSAAFCQRHH